MIQRILLLFLLINPSFLFAQVAKTKFTKSDQDYYDEAKKALDRNDVALCIGISEEGVKHEPKNMDLQNLLGKAYTQAGNYDKARTQLLYVLKIQPRNWDAKRNLINVEFQDKHYSAALSHINEFLDHAPFDSQMWTKKITIYETLGHEHEAQRLVNRLYAIFPQDSNAKRLNSYYSQKQAAQSMKSGNLIQAKDDLSNVLKSDPKNYDVHVQLINTLIKNGNREDALQKTENALLVFPANKYFVSKKLGLLEDQRKYAEAIEFAEYVQKNYRGISYKAYITNLKFQQARQARKNEPSAIYEELLITNPGNEEATAFLINNAMSKGMYDEALVLLNKSLKSQPNNKDLLQKKFVALQNLNRDGQAFALAEKLFNSNRGSEEYREQYLSLALRNAKDLVAGRQWTNAEELLKKISPYSSVQPMVKEYLFTVYSQQKKTPQALATINDLIRSNPKNENFKLSKIGYLEEIGDLNAALEATNSLPRGQRYKETYNSLSMPLAKKFIEEEKYEDALTMVDKILLNDDQNYQAYQYALNVCDALKRYEDGIGYADVALQFFPDSKETMLKRAGFLQALKRHNESTNLLGELQTKYPYSDKIKNSLLEERSIYAKNFLRQNERDSAMNLYKLNYALEPNDTTTIYKMINLYLDEKNTDSALTYINKGLEENPDNHHLLMKKAVTYEMKKQFDSSYYYANKLIPKESQNYRDYADYLFSKTLRNQAGIIFLRTTFDTIQNSNSLASFQYTRFNPKNIYTYRLNYRARNNGTAVQHEFDWTHTIDKKTYSMANIGIANKDMFPYFKIEGSLFRSYPKEYEGEIGLKYLYLKDFSAISAIAGLSKTYNDIWINARGFIMFDGTNFYNAARLTSRLYMNNRTEYFSIIAGYGTPPDDKSLDFIINKFVGIVTRYVGAGYQKEFRYRTTLGIIGSWNNIRIQEAAYFNQYNVFITALRKF